MAIGNMLNPSFDVCSLEFFGYGNYVPSVLAAITDVEK
jgi:hypothetical protein